jgi:hypothetical protein
MRQKTQFTLSIGDKLTKPGHVTSLRRPFAYRGYGTTGRQTSLPSVRNFLKSLIGATSMAPRII